MRTYQTGVTQSPKARLSHAFEDKSLEEGEMVLRAHKHMLMTWRLITWSCRKYTVAKSIPWRKTGSYTCQEVILYFLIGNTQKQYIRTLINPHHVSSFLFLLGGQSPLIIWLIQFMLLNLSYNQSLLLSTSWFSRLLLRTLEPRLPCTALLPFSYSCLMLLGYQYLTLATLIDYLLAIRDPRV